MGAGGAPVLSPLSSPRAEGVLDLPQAGLQQLRRPLLPMPESPQGLESTTAAIHRSSQPASGQDASWLQSSDDMGDLQDLKDRDDQAVGTQMGSGSILFMRDVPTSAEVSRYNKENKENARRAPSEQMQDTFMFTSYKELEDSAVTQSMLRTLSVFHRWRLEKVKRVFSKQLEGILGDISQDEAAMESMQRRLGEREGYVATLEKELHRFRELEEETSERMDVLHARTRQLEADLLVAQASRAGAERGGDQHPPVARSEIQRMAEKHRHEREEGNRERRLLVEQLARRDQDMESAHSKTHELEVMVAGLKAALDASEQRVANGETETRRVQSQANEQITRAHNDAGERVAAAAEDSDRARADADARIKDMRDEVDTYRRRMAEKEEQTRGEVDAARAEMERHLQKAHSWEVEVTKCHERLGTAEQENAKLERRMSELQVLEEQAQQKVVELQENILVLTAAKEELERSLSRMERASAEEARALSLAGSARLAASITDTVLRGLEIAPGPVGDERLAEGSRSPSPPARLSSPPVAARSFPPYTHARPPPARTRRSRSVHSPVRTGSSASPGGGGGGGGGCWAQRRASDPGAMEAAANQPHLAGEEGRAGWRDERRVSWGPEHGAEGAGGLHQGGAGAPVGYGCAQLRRRGAGGSPPFDETELEDGADAGDAVRSIAARLEKQVRENNNMKAQVVAAENKARQQRLAYEAVQAELDAAKQVVRQGWEQFHGQLPDWLRALRSHRPRSPQHQHQHQLEARSPLHPVCTNFAGEDAEVSSLLLEVARDDSVLMGTADSPSDSILGRGTLATPRTAAELAPREWEGEDVRGGTSTVHDGREAAEKNGPEQADAAAEVSLKLSEELVAYKRRAEAAEKDRDEALAHAASLARWSHEAGDVFLRRWERLRTQNREAASYWRWRFATAKRKLQSAELSLVLELKRTQSMRKVHEQYSSRLSVWLRRNNAHKAVLQGDVAFGCWKARVVARCAAVWWWGELARRLSLEASPSRVLLARVLHMRNSNRRGRLLKAPNMLVREQNQAAVFVGWRASARATKLHAKSRKAWDKVEAVSAGLPLWIQHVGNQRQLERCFNRWRVRLMLAQHTQLLDRALSAQAPAALMYSSSAGIADVVNLPLDTSASDTSEFSHGALESSNGSDWVHIADDSPPQEHRARSARAGTSGMYEQAGHSTQLSGGAPGKCHPSTQTSSRYREAAAAVAAHAAAEVGRTSRVAGEPLHGIAHKTSSKKPWRAGAVLEDKDGSNTGHSQSSLGMSRNGAPNLRTKNRAELRKGTGTALSMHRLAAGMTIQEEAETLREVLCEPNNKDISSDRSFFQTHPPIRPPTQNDTQSSSGLGKPLSSPDIKGPQPTFRLSRKVHYPLAGEDIIMALMSTMGGSQRELGSSSSHLHQKSNSRAEGVRNGMLAESALHDSANGAVKDSGQRSSNSPPRQVIPNPLTFRSAKEMQEAVAQDEAVLRRVQQTVHDEVQAFRNEMRAALVEAPFYSATSESTGGGTGPTKPMRRSRSHSPLPADSSHRPSCASTRIRSKSPLDATRTQPGNSHNNPSSQQQKSVLSGASTCNKGSLSSKAASSRRFGANKMDNEVLRETKAASCGALQKSPEEKSNSVAWKSYAPPSCKSSTPQQTTVRGLQSAGVAQLSHHAEPVVKLGNVGLQGRLAMTTSGGPMPRLGGDGKHLQN